MRTNYYLLESGFGWQRVTKIRRYSNRVTAQQIYHNDADTGRWLPYNITHKIETFKTFHQCKKQHLSSWGWRNMKHITKDELFLLLL